MDGKSQTPDISSTTGPKTVLGCLCALCGKSATRADSLKHHITGVYGKNGRTVKSTCPYRTEEIQWDKAKHVITNVLFHKSQSLGGLGDPVDAELIPNLKQASENKLAVTSKAARKIAAPTSAHGQPTIFAVLCYLCGESFTRKDSVGHHVNGRNGRTGNRTKKCPMSTEETIWDHNRVKENVLCYMKTKRSPGRPVEDAVIEALLRDRDEVNTQKLSRSQQVNTILRTATQKQSKQGKHGESEVDSEAVSQHRAEQAKSGRAPSPKNSTSTDITRAKVREDRSEEVTASRSLFRSFNNTNSAATAFAGLGLHYKNFGLPLELRYAVLRQLLMIPQYSDFVGKPSRYEDFAFPVLAINKQVRSEGLDILMHDNMWVRLEISHSSNLNILEFFSERLDDQAYVEERVWRGRMKPSLVIEVGIMTADCDRMGHITSTSYLFAFNAGQLERFFASIRAVAPSIHFLRVQYTEHKLLSRPGVIEFSLIAPLSIIRGCSGVRIRGDFGRHDLNALAASMMRPLPDTLGLVEELQDRLSSGERSSSQGLVAQALLIFDIGAYLADHAQSTFDDLPHSTLENLFDDLRCKLSRMACEVKCILVNSKRLDGNITEEACYWAEKAIENANDSFSFCGISDDDIGQTHLARARAYDLTAQWEVQKEQKVSMRAAKLYTKAVRDYLCALRIKGEVMEIENRLMEIESLLGDVEE